MRRTATPMISGKLDRWSDRPAIVFVLEDNDGVEWLHDRLRELAHGEVGHFADFHGVKGVDLEGIATLRLTVSDVSPEIALVAAGEREFAWICDRDGWAAIADLMEPFLAGRKGHQYLHHAFGTIGEVDVVISRGEKAPGGGPELAPEPLPPVPEMSVDEPKEEVMTDAKTKKKVADPPPAPESSGGSEPFAARVFGVTIPCSDLERSSTFYGEVLGVEPDDAVSGRVFFSAGGARIVLVEDPGLDSASPTEFFFAAGSLEETQASVAESGGEITSPIAVSWSGERSFGCTDPDGNRLWFVDATTIRVPAA